MGEERYRWSDWEVTRGLMGARSCFTRLIVRLIKRRAICAAVTQGVGRHSREQQQRTAGQNLRALRDLLGNQLTCIRPLCLTLMLTSGVVAMLCWIRLVWPPPTLVVVVVEGTTSWNPVRLKICTFVLLAITLVNSVASSCSTTLASWSCVLWCILQTAC